MDQGLANFFSEGSDSKDFRLWGPYGFCCSAVVVCMAEQPKSIQSVAVLEIR